MKKNELDYDAPSVSDMLGEQFNYRVPAYQRGYAWGDEQVGQLLEDTLDSFQRNPDDSYILGQIILSYSGENGTLEIVDGQQRITTLYLLIASAWTILDAADRKEAFGVATKVQFNSVTGKLFRADSQGDLAPRVQVSKAGQEYISKILAGESLSEAEDESLTQQNIRSAHNQIQEFFNKELNTPDELFRYLWFVLQKVLFFSLTLSSAAQALSVFAKMNNRGLTLDDADLLKNLLFQTASDDEYTKLSKHWDAATDELFKARLKRVKSMQFLLKALVGVETGESISNPSVFEKWKEILTEVEEGVDPKSVEAFQAIRSRTNTFASTLPARAKNLQHLSHCKTPSGEEAPYNYGSYWFKWVQHFEVLLAGDHLQSDSYRQLAHVVEDRVVLSIFSGEKNQKFEAMVHKWSRNISLLNSFATKEEILEASATALENVDELLEDAKLSISRLDYRIKSQRDKQRYLLARIARSLEIEAEEATDQVELKDFMQTAPKRSRTPGNHLDHVFPQSESKRGDWKDGSNYDLIHTLGNLVLLHGSDNSFQSDALPDEEIKTTNYASSFVVNKMLCPEGSLRALPNRILKVVHLKDEFGIAVLTDWGPIAIQNRFNLYWHLFEKSIRKTLGK